jgi:radical SAM protein with 4Fe4S-binding SPASM domain
VGEVASWYADTMKMPKEEASRIVADFLKPLEKLFSFEVDKVSEQGLPKIPITSIAHNVTLACNLRCPHCFATAGEPYSYELTIEEFRKFVDDAWDLTDHERNFFNFTGGEPLLRWEYLAEAIRYLRRKGILLITLNTNALLMTEEIAKSMKDLEISNVTVSLDGTTPDTHEFIRGPGTFAKTISALEMLRKYDVMTTIGLTVHAGNIHQVPDMFRFCADHGFYLFISPMAPHGRVLKNPIFSSQIEIFHAVARCLKELKDLKPERILDLSSDLPTAFGFIRKPGRWFYCGLGQNTTFLDANGDVYPCVNAVGIPQLKVGNVKDNSFDFREAFYNSPAYKLARSLAPVKANPKCSQCDIRYICCGSCRAITYWATGDLNAAWPRCEDIHATFIESMRLLAEDPTLMERFMEAARELSQKLKIDIRGFSQVQVMR